MAKQQEVSKQLVQLLKATEGSDLTRDIEIYEEMYPLIAELEKEPLVQRRNTRTLDGLLKWLEAHGINTNNLELRFCDSGCGVFAMKNISREEELVKIPQYLMITSVPDNEELIKLVQSDLMLQKVPHIVLILRIMQEVANPSSFWRQYLESLPTSFSLPMFYSLEKMNDLKGLSVHHDAIRDVFTTLKTFIHLENLNHKYSWLRNRKFTFSSFRWARAIALTRQNPIKAKNDEIKHLALIPFYDMFNHRQGPITAYFDAESKISVLKSNQAFVKGSEIFMSYGSRPNQDLFLYSGFVDSLNTSNDRIKIFLTIQNQDKRRDERIKLLKLYGLSTNSYYTLHYDFNNPETSQLLTYLYVMNLPENELHAVTKIQHFDFSTIPLTAMKKSYQWLKMKCMVNLRILSTKAKSEDMIINELLDAEKYLLNKTIENLQGLIDNQN